jgi:hypothetical protein
MSKSKIRNICSCYSIVKYRDNQLIIKVKIKGSRSWVSTRYLPQESQAHCYGTSFFQYRKMHLTEMRLNACILLKHEQLFSLTLVKLWVRCTTAIMHSLGIIP